LSGDGSEPQAHMNPLLPDNILRCLSPADRRSLGRAGMTAAEAQARYAVRSERGEQRLFAAWLSSRGLPYVQPRPDRKSGIKPGWPDFSVHVGNRSIFIEMKVQGGKLSPEQVECIEALRREGFRCEVVYSAAEAITLTRKFFELV